MSESRFSKFMTKNMPVYTWDTVHNLVGVPLSEILFLTYCVCKNTTNRGNRFLRYSFFVKECTEVIKPYNRNNY